MEAAEALTEGIEPDWWRKTVGQLLPLDQVLAVYASGAARWDSVIQMLELRGDTALLALTPGSLVGMRLSQVGERSSLHVEKWSVSLDHVSSVASVSDARFDRQNANLSGVGHFRVTINLDAPLGEMGAEITLPVNWREDYGGRSEVAEARATRFCEVLEELLARGRQAG